ncbi:metalloregulator ArsR/SmtB family transcription factor [Streptomyces sp. NPDC093272]|uniref:ArsR/SmtB family transcription factor n=1 Tax=unclassified Streptomyces TaxID=2593676 RepID=UPI003416D9E5
MLTSVDTDVIRVLGDPLRLQIVTLLARETLCATHVVEKTGGKQPNISNHLKALREAGVIETEPCGRFTYYKLHPGVLDTLANAFGELAETARTTVNTNRKRACP